jgi:hypothetical protein
VKRRRFFGLLGAVAAAPAVAKAAEPAKVAPDFGHGMVDRMHALQSLVDDGLIDKESLSELLAMDRPTGLVSPKALQLGQGDRIITAIDRDAGVIYASKDGGAWSESDYAYHRGDVVNFEVGDFLVWEDIE